MNYKYFAFISYNSQDTKWGKSLHKKLEHYSIPATLCKKRGWPRKPIRPVFFAPAEIQPGGLSEELKKRLRSSKFLVVICSPHSAQSQWVGREIRFFHELGRTEQILFFIVDGVPNSNDVKTECFNPVIKDLGIPEQLGANIRQKTYRLQWLNKERAYVQLISKMLGVEFDAIWRRHRRLLIKKTAAWAAGIFMVLLSLLCVWQNSLPIDISVKMVEKTATNSHLPAMKEATATIFLENETKTLVIPSPGISGIARNIPHKYLNKPVRITVSCRDFINVDTIVNLQKENIISISRDPYAYGDVHFHLWNLSKGEPIPYTKVTIGKHETTSDGNGLVRLLIPLEDQRRKYPVITALQLANDSIIMPCGDDDILFTQ